MTVTGNSSSTYHLVYVNSQQYNITALTELDDAMLEHMTYIVFVERRPFSFKDFFRFEVNGKEYKMEHGTFRNKISKLNKKWNSRTSL